MSVNSPPNLRSLDEQREARLCFTRGVKRMSRQSNRWSQQPAGKPPGFAARTAGMAFCPTGSASRVPVVPVRGISRQPLARRDRRAYR